MAVRGRFDHLDVYVSDLATSVAFWGPLLELLGFTKAADRPTAQSWKGTGAEVFLVQTEPDFVGQGYHRKRIGLNHLAFAVTDRAELDEVLAHVLDVAAGRPAAGIAVTLERGDAVVARGTTDADGRIRELAQGLAPGTYRLVFETRTPFFRRVALDIEIGEGPHHVPLMLSPFGVSTYRGS